MQCNRYTASGICCVVVVVVVIILTIMFKGMTGDDIDNTNDVAGNHNNIQTDNTKEVSLLHIETLASGQRVTNWTVILGFTIILVLFGFTVFYQRSRKRARRIIKEYERDELLDKISAMEEELVTRGFLQKPRARKGRKTKKTKKSKKSLKALKKKQKTKDIEAQIDSSAEESED